MIYENDINYFKKQKQPPLPFEKFLKAKFQPKSKFKLYNDKKSSTNQILNESLWNKYCENTAVHGMKYLTNPQIHFYERIIWAFIILLGIIGTICTSFIISYRYRNSGLQTLIESTIQPISTVPFPAVTFCPSNRLNFSKFNEAKTKFLKNNSTIANLFERFFTEFEIFQFGKFGSFKIFENDALHLLDDLNITEIIKFLSYKCAEVLGHNCFWKKKLYPCCEMFLPQEGELGYCLTFNSETNSIGRERKLKDPYYPLRVAQSGPRSGLQIEFKKNHLNDSKEFSIAVHNTNQWPSNGIFMNVNSGMSIVINVKASYEDNETIVVDPHIRECLFDQEVPLYQTRYPTLPDLNYLQKNCMSECHQRYLLQICNCTVDLLFPIGNYKSCKPSDFICLGKHASFFSNEITLDEKKHVNASDIGMQCSCLFECSSIEYQVEHYPTSRSQKNIKLIKIDVYFRQATFIQYRTNLVFNRIDLLVAFGGIAGLFLGSSLFSGAELIYYLTVGLATCLLNRRRRTVRKKLRLFNFRQTQKKNKICLKY